MKYDFYGISILEDSQVKIIFCNNEITSLGKQFINIIYDYKSYADKTLKELQELYITIKD